VLAKSSLGPIVDSSAGITDGMLDSLGLSEGIPVGLSESSEDGEIDLLGFSEGLRLGETESVGRLVEIVGRPVGFDDTVGFNDGYRLG
jgi:hypothetical protein